MMRKLWVEQEVLSNVQEFLTLIILSKLGMVND